MFNLKSFFFHKKNPNKKIENFYEKDDGFFLVEQYIRDYIKKMNIYNDYHMKDYIKDKVDFFIKNNYSIIEKTNNEYILQSNTEKYSNEKVYVGYYTTINKNGIPIQNYYVNKMKI